ncbi:hypothetical protein [Candidatus Arthromitus sp. SFB-turkey]|uniref:hypothetical protein n=1 Tax=Candidatus Arthromitus sp. SFB-turkey TaxID=1840217 RepID=UPI0007F3528F|nr:hypothetical protein [Candidatus Arthromitus sp. SFB-turkey]OAT89969.1 hypothetical protein A6P36_07800 [Candidatus Arthromitus sp. SFB-turkey]HJC99463.1 hypothetical protein [Candidatus Dwaynia gallinarum]
MNVKINKYFLVLLFLILFLGIFNLYTGNSKYVNNLYFNKIEGVFDNFSIIDEILNSEIDNYLKNNYVSKYSIKEIRDNYTNMKLNVQDIVREINLVDYYEDLNKKYLVDILYDVLEVIDNDFLVNDIFNSDDEIIIKNLQKIRDDFEKVLNKYNVFKINFGIFSI